MNPKVSIILNGFLQMECSPSKTFPYFSYCTPLGIESANEQDYKNKEVIIADGKSRYGAFGIRNRAIKKCSGDIFLFVDGDVKLADKSFITKMIRIFEETRADVVIGSSSPDRDNQTLFQWLLNLEYEEREMNMGEGWVDAGGLLYFCITREALEGIGGIPLKSLMIDTGNSYFDSGFLDWDLCGLLREEGYTIWHTKKLRIHHQLQTDIWSYFKKQFIQAWVRVPYYKRFKRIREGYTKFNFFYPPVWKFYKKTKDKRVLLLYPFYFIRDIVWIAGIIKGFWDFYIM